MHFAASKPLFLFTALFILMTLGCQQAERSPNTQMAKEAPIQDAAESSAGVAAAPESRSAMSGNDPLNPFGTSVAAASSLDSIRKFIRTAELKFRVGEVLPATLEIENVALRNQGFVTTSNLSCELEYSEVQPISRDSALETTRFSVHAHLVIRVPYRQLDTTLRAMNHLMQHLDYRNVRAEEVALKLLTEQLVQQRQNDYQQELNRASQNGKQAILLPAADRKLNSRTIADESRIARLKLEDAIQFSTVEIDIYQAPQIRRQTIANTEIQPAQWNFWWQLGKALRSGVDLMQMLVLGLAHIWVVILLVVLAYFGLKRYRRNL